MPKKVMLPLEVKLSENSTDELPEVTITGYTGNSVSLRGYPYYINEPVVYNMSGIALRDNVPYMEDHTKLVGHTLSNKMQNGNLVSKAVHSDPGEDSQLLYKRMKNGIPYQASMGLEIDSDSVTYVAEGKVTVNNKEFKAPLFVVNKSRLTEMSATLFGRDSDTSVSLSQDFKDGKELLMLVKNSKTAELGDTSPPENKPSAETVFENAVPSTELTPSPVPSLPPTPVPPVVSNSVSASSSSSMDWLFDYVNHPTGKDLISNARKEGWDEDKMEREIKAKEIENSYPGIPGVNLPDNKVDNSYLARLAYGCGVNIDFIKNKLGEKAADYAFSQGTMSLREGLMLCANANGGRFNGFSDVANMSKFVKGMVVRNGFSTINFPNLMHRVTMWKLEETWMLDAPQAPALCKPISSKDFKKTGHLKPRGGKMWEGFNDEGKLTHGTMGDEDKYESELKTVGQIVTFRREDIINDDIGWIEEALNLMVEGATMIPDYQLVNLIYGANGAGVLNASGDKQSYFTLALTEANLRTVYNKVRRRYTEKEAADGDKTVNGRYNTRWSLVTGPDLEETAWELLKQERVVSNTTANTKQGSKNFWFNRVDHTTFDNMDNDSYHASAVSGAWMLLPQRDTYKPFYINYLNGQSKPVTEVVDLPADELGFGVRGYWDVHLGYRPVEDNKVQACAISIP